MPKGEKMAQVRKGQGQKGRTRSQIDNYTGQSHERDQLRGAFAGDKNENYLRDHGTKEKNRKKQDHDTPEDIIEERDPII